MQKSTNAPKKARFVKTGSADYQCITIKELCNKSREAHIALQNRPYYTSKQPILQHETTQTEEQ